MTLIQFRQLGDEALLSTTPIPSAEALALASSPGGCLAGRFSLFVEVDAGLVSDPGFAPGGFAAIEFILPGKPGRWRAAGEIVMAVVEPRPDAPCGLGLELVGLALCADAQVLTAPAVEPNETESAVETSEQDAASLEPFDASSLTIDHTEVAGMLGDLIGRDVSGELGGSLSESIGEQCVLAVFRDEDEQATFLIALDKGAAARIGGALTMIATEEIQAAVEAPEPLAGEPLTNAGEVLNIMAALFHEAGSPRVALAETLSGADLAAEKGGELATLVAEASWRLEFRIDIEEYGGGELLLLAR